MENIMLSVIIPSRNEVRFIGQCLDSIIAQNYPKENMEVLVMDGMSEDRTREIVQKYIQDYPFIKLLDNVKKITPCALNIGIKNAKGEIIMRMDAHNQYRQDYIRNCIKYLNEYNANNVGGVWKILPRGDNIIGKGIACLSSHPFGVANAYYKFTTKKEPTWVSHVPFFCCRREVFGKIGLFNENLLKGQDYEFDKRLKKLGGRILLVPEIVSYYYARSDLKSFCEHSFINGLWVIMAFKYASVMPICLRRLVPLGFILGLLGSLTLSSFLSIFWWIYLFIIFSYSIINLYFSFRIAIREKDIRLLFLMPFIFTIYHFSYGLGSLCGLIFCLVSKKFWLNLKNILVYK